MNGEQTKRYPVVSYYIATLLISWGGLILVRGGTDRINSHSTDIPFLPLYFVTVAGPSIAGIVLTGLYDGKKGYRSFFSQLVKWRVQVKWYAIALLVAPLTVFTILFILYLFSSVFLPGIFSVGNNPVASAFGLPNTNKVSLSLFVVMLGLFNGFVEEIGWTGFATSRMKITPALISTGLTIGMMWGLWHFLSNYIGSADGAGSLPLPLYLAATLFSFLPPFRIIMTWVYAYTGSLLIAILMHTSLDVFWILSTPLHLTGEQRVIWYLAWAIVLWGIVAAINISRKKANHRINPNQQ